MTSIMTLCALCQLPCNALLKDETFTFCCSGCKAVFSVLKAKNFSQPYTTHPLFLEAIQAGLISNPLLSQTKEKTKENYEVNRLDFEIENLWCPSCSEVIVLYLMQNEGIKSCYVDYATDLASIEFYPQLISKEAIFLLIEKIGYQPSLIKFGEKKINYKILLRLVIALFSAMNIMMFSYPIYLQHLGVETDGYTPLLSWLSFISILPVVTYCAWPIWQRCYGALKVSILGMDALIFLGTFFGLLLSFIQLSKGKISEVYFDSLSMLIVFVLLGKIIEQKAKFSAKSNLWMIERSVPRKARKKTVSGFDFVALDELKIGEQLIIYTGEKIPLDGVILEGHGTCDESLITGEAKPVLKTSGQFLISGAIVTQGTFIIEITKDSKNATLQKIIDIIKGDINQKPKHFLIVDKITKFFVPMILVLALCLFGYMAIRGNWQEGFLRSIGLFLIACPCAIGIAIPMVESFFLAKMVKLGAIVRNRSALFLLGKETLFVFDKTGSLTEGKFKIKKGLEKLSDLQQSILKTLCSFSHHPVSQAIFYEISLPVLEMQSIQEISGKGMEGIYDEKIYFLGSHVWMKEKKIFSQEYSNENHLGSFVFFANEEEVLSILDLEDSLRSGAEELCSHLTCDKMILSGDSKQSVSKVGKALSIPTYIAECSPLNKRDLVNSEKAKTQIVAMLGDGINDAPALTASHIGISIMTASDISIHVSDILLTSPCLKRLIDMRKLATKGRKIIKQNLFWAFFYNSVGIILAIVGLLNPLYAALAMALSSLIVIGNSYRMTF